MHDDHVDGGEYDPAADEEWTITSRAIRNMIADGLSEAEGRLKNVITDAMVKRLVPVVQTTVVAMLRQYGLIP